MAELHRALAERHLAAASEAVDDERLPLVEERLLGLLGELVEAIGRSPRNPKARRDEIAVYGERLSAEILAGAVLSQGVPAAVAEDPIATDANFGGAEVDAAATRERCGERVVPAIKRRNGGRRARVRRTLDPKGLRPRSVGEGRTSPRR
jgi:aspartate kinase